MKELRCSDVGFECEGVIRGETEDDVLRQATQHLEDAHAAREVPIEELEDMRAHIRDA